MRARIERWLTAMAIGSGGFGCSDQTVKGVEEMPEPGGCRKKGADNGSFRCSRPTLVVHKDVDILFVIDDATIAPQARLAAAADAFVDAVQQVEPEVSLRIGVVSTDNGNPVCDLALDEGGSLQATSCRAREHEFDSPEAFAAGVGTTNLRARAGEVPGVARNRPPATPFQPTAAGCASARSTHHTRGGAHFQTSTPWLTALAAVGPAKTEAVAVPKIASPAA